jgi:REP element-mobilizing transposase RayT
MPVESFNLDPPPFFEPYNPEAPTRFYTRHLPHWRRDGVTYHVTFRLANSLPKEKLDSLRNIRERWETSNLGDRDHDAWRTLSKRLRSKVETWLDQGAGSCHFKNPAMANELARSILHFQNIRYHVFCYVVMPNHCHLLIRPFDGFDLEDLIGSMKGVTSRFVNKAIDSSGAIWQSESFDQIIRDEEHLYRVVQYIGNNPRNAGLPESGWNRWIHPDWDTCSWGFREP